MLVEAEKRREKKENNAQWFRLTNAGNLFPMPKNNVIVMQKSQSISYI